MSSVLSLYFFSLCLFSFTSEKKIPIRICRPADQSLEANLHDADQRFFLLPRISFGISMVPIANNRFCASFEE